MLARNGGPAQGVKQSGPRFVKFPSQVSLRLALDTIPPHIPSMTQEPIHTRLNTGAPVLLHPLRPSDRIRMLLAIEQLSDWSRYLRFFTGMKAVPNILLDRLTDADGDQHVAWCATDMTRPSRPIIGAAHAIRTEKEGISDFALGVVDAYHGQGVARLLIGALLLQSRAQGVTGFTAQVLLENNKARGLFKALGSVVTERDGPVATLSFDTALMQQRLIAMPGAPGLEDVSLSSGETERAGRPA